MMVSARVVGMAVALSENSRVKVRRPSTFALKQVMAITGILFVAFVFIHMIGNLKVYWGPEALNAYAAWLRVVGYPLIPERGVLWVLRVVLLASVIAHVGSALVLWARGRRARGRFRRRRLRGLMANGARLMLPSGVVALVFVVVHLLDLTIGRIVAPASFSHGDAYGNLVASFSRLWMAAFYSLTMLLIGLHIFHGWRALLQDLGATGHRLRLIWVSVGAFLALGILLGNATIPVLVQLGIIA
jgi:succinate dehydrogenase / fumarate reductase cytochrome b subunit